MPEIDTVIIAIDVAAINGGAAKVAIEEAKGLAAIGRRVIYFAASGPVDPGLTAAGVEVVCLDQPDIVDDPNRWAAMRRGLWNGTAARRLSEIVARVDPARSILHGHGFSRGLSPAIGPVLTGAPMPHVFTMHDYFLACPNGGFFDYPRQEICTRRALGPACLTTHCDARHPAHKAWRIGRQLLLAGPGRMPRGLRDIIYISQTQLDVMRPYLPPQARLHHLANPVDLDPEAPRIQAEDNDIFLYVGRLSPEKGAVEFARAARAAGVRAVFLGSGPEEAAIRAANPEAELVGWVSASEVAQWMSRARALVFPSLWREPFGLVACEALTKGLPVIVGQWSAAAEIVEHEETGLIYAENAQLSLQLTRMTPSAALRLSCNAYVRRESYGMSSTRHVESLAQIYRRSGYH